LWEYGADRMISALLLPVYPLRVALRGGACARKHGCDPRVGRPGPPCHGARYL
jgi:hypothetical protein